ncbi:MAG: hypothetical protein ACTSW1_15855 [Candidatus Hodarchaeales archaeon]
MAFWKLFKKAPKREDPNLTPEYIESLPSVDDATFYRDSKRLLQRFDEYITSSEAESESLSIELDACIEKQESLKFQLKSLDKPNSWHERHLLLKLDRLQLHSKNLIQRIEIYSQNIKIYLNLISKIQDVKAMRMNGLDEEKIETIWVEFQQTLDQYRDRVLTEAAGFHSDPVTTRELENRLGKLRDELFPVDKKEKSVKKVVPEENSSQRKSIEDLMEERDQQQHHIIEELDDNEEEEPEVLLE